MKPSNIIKAIALNVLAGKVTYLEGAPGIGKSSLPAEAARANGWDCLILPPAPTIEPVDLRGAMKVITPDDAKNFNLDENFIGTTLAFPPDFLPRVAKKTTLVVIDDVPTALPAVQAALFQLLLDRRLGNYIVPENVHFVLTGNRLEDRAGAGRTLTALDSRVNRIQQDVSLEDWIDWANKTSIQPELIAFHRFHKGEFLHKFDPTKKVNPLPRTWAALSRSLAVINESRAKGEVIPNDLELELYEGDVGKEAALSFVGFNQVFRNLPNPAECLKNPTTAPIPEGADMIATVVCLTTALSRMVTQQTFGNLLKYLSRLQKEYEVMCIQDAINQKAVLKETSAYTQWAVKNQEILTGSK